jgi:hypothetical protein
MKRRGDPGLSGHLLFFQLDPSHWDGTQQDEFWTELDTWLSTRGLYLGGVPSGAAVYATSQACKSPALIWQVLQAKLDAAQVRRLQVNVQALALREHAQLEWAALEAVRGAQSSLTEAASLCGEDFDKLLINLRPRR